SVSESVSESLSESTKPANAKLPSMGSKADNFNGLGASLLFSAGVLAAFKRRKKDAKSDK
ncbi:hypothetical protein, partial [Enterococcus cecorum]|uniref:hypothetical protein n=1 Tax=Enterococcus cecorum TaxID=44008 RepID=UPI00065A6198